MPSPPFIFEYLYFQYKLVSFKVPVIQSRESWWKVRMIFISTHLILIMQEVFQNLPFQPLGWCSSSSSLTSTLVSCWLVSGGAWEALGWRVSSLVAFCCNVDLHSFVCQPNNLVHGLDAAVFHCSWNDFLPFNALYFVSGTLHSNGLFVTNNCLSSPQKYSSAALRVCFR